MKKLILLAILLHNNTTLADESAKKMLIEMGVAEYIDSWFYSALVSQKEANGIRLHYIGSTPNQMHLTVAGCTASKNYFEVNGQFLDVICDADSSILKSKQASEFVYQQALTGGLQINYHTDTATAIKATFDTQDVEQMLTFTNEKYAEHQNQTNNIKQRKANSF